MITLNDIAKLKGRYPTGTKLAVTMNWPHKQGFDKRHSEEEVIETRRCVICQATNSCAMIEVEPEKAGGEVMRTTFQWVDLITGEVKVELI